VSLTSHPARILALVLAAGLLLPAFMADGVEPVIVTSRSKQFVVHGPNPIFVRARPPADPSADLLKLEPALLAASCEEIKESLLSELGMAPRKNPVSHSRPSHEDKIYLLIHPPLEHEVVIEAIPSDPAWTYRVIVPTDVESKRLVTAIVKVLLLEMANRSGPEQIAEVPPWLVTGLSAHLRATTVKPLVLQGKLPISPAFVRADPSGSGQWVVFGNATATAQSRVHLDASAAAREHLRKNAPFSFEELSWPEDLPVERHHLFEPAAHLFVQELLRLPNGPALLRQFLHELPNHWNWQFAFLRAFQPHFSTLLDVEKWWGLALTYTRRLEPEQHWRLHESWRSLENSLRVPVQVHLSPDALPHKEFLSFQEVIREWHASDQRPVLENALQQLASMRLRLPLELVPLLDGYVSALRNYLHRLPQAEPASPRRGRQPVNIGVLKNATCRALDALDQERLALRPKLFPSTREEAILSALEIANQKQASRAAAAEKEQLAEPMPVRQ
jgi:hypothetical protein